MSRLQLEISTPSGMAPTVPLTAETYTVGRDPTSTICLNDARVSRQHAQIYLRDGFYRIEDGGSANGLLISGAPLKGSTVLTPGMQISMGGCVLTVSLVPLQPRPTPPLEQASLLPAEPVAAAAAAVDGGASSRYVLVALDGPRPGSTFALPVGTSTIGRDARHPISIDDPSISRQHAQLTVDANGLQVVDLQSSNGTFVDEVRCTSQILRPGNRLRCGNISFDLVSAGEATSQRQVGPPRGPRPSLLQIICLVAACLAGSVGSFRLLQRRAGPHPDWRGVAERAEQAQLGELLQAGADASQGGDWQAGLVAYRQALRLDPVNPQARAGLSLAEKQRLAAQMLARAHQAINQNMPMQALSIAAGFPEGQLGPKAQDVFARARQQAAAERVAAANAACKGMQWRICQQQAATLLLYLPQHVAAQALVQEAENGLRTSRASFRSFPIPCAEVRSRLPQSDVREAALRYASGDVDTALQRLKNYRVMGGANLASQRIHGAREAWGAGEAARQKANMTAAMSYFSRGVELDSQLLGHAACSVWGSRLKNKLCEGLLRIGQQAFDRGQYPQAFNAWQRAAEYDPDASAVTLAIGRLENRAASLVSDISTLPELDHAACKRLQSVLAMTLSGSAAHRGAMAKLRECNASSEDTED
jgi:pSer/pThr/pTyr-binding forkhead associated (FHA) protein/tetratricopeptide (TPR) repeat protein